MSAQALWSLELDKNPVRDRSRNAWPIENRDICGPLVYT